MSAVSKHCVCCDAPASLTCAGCKNATYCNERCQTSDWRVHRSLCKTFAKFEDAPAANMRRGILLPANSTKPKFIWIRTYTEANNDEGDLEEEDLEEIDPRYGIPTFDNTTKSEFVARTDLTADVDSSKAVVAGRLGGGQLLNCSIHVIFDPNFLLDPSKKPNKCLLHIMRGGSGEKWRGDLILVGMGKVMLPTSVHDLDTNHLRIGARGIRFLQSGIGIQWPPPNDEVIDAVSISPNGTFEQVALHKSHPIFQPRFSAATPMDLMGMIYVTYEYPAAPFDMPKDGAGPPCPAAYLEISSEVHNFGKYEDKAAAPFGQIPPYFMKSTQNVLIVSKEDIDFQASPKSIALSEARGLCEYCKDVVQPLLLKHSGTLTTRESIIFKFSQYHFLEYLAEIRYKGHADKQRAMQLIEDKVYLSDFFTRMADEHSDAPRQDEFNPADFMK